jgi:ribosomal subunit interface protein
LGSIGPQFQEFEKGLSFPGSRAFAQAFAAALDTLWPAERSIPMQVRVSGKQVDVGDALRSRIVEELTGHIGKFFERGGSAEVALSREGHLFKVDCLVTLASGQQVVSHAYADEAHGAFSAALEKMEKRVRRYKRRLKNHHGTAGRQDNGRQDSERAPVTVLRPLDSDDEDEAADDSSSQGQQPPAAMIIAETELELKTMTVGMAVLELDLTNYPVILFRNAAHGGLSVVYRRPDGNVGWIDPERVRSGNSHKSVA